MSEQPTEDLAAVTRDLRELCANGATDRRLLDSGALMALVVAGLDIRQDLRTDVLASLVRTVLMRVADQVRHRAIADLPHELNPHSSPVCQAAGAAELLQIKSDESEALFEEAKADRCGEVDWREIKRKRDNAGPKNEVYLRASVWLDSIGARNARRLEVEMLKAFASAIHEYLTDEGMRQEIRSFVDAERGDLAGVSHLGEEPVLESNSGSQPSATRRTAIQPELQRTIDQLAEAVRSELEDAQRVDRVNDPFPMPVRWATTEKYPADHGGNIWGERTDSPPVEMSGMIDQVSDLMEAVPSKRLVILGPGGAGKSILVRALALALLEQREPGQPVPYIFQLYSWNPADESLHQWMTKQLIEDHPALKAVVDKIPLADRLIRARCIVPILDGLDEMTSVIRKAVIPAINKSLGQLDEVIVTSRPDEYAEAAEASDVLTSAGVVELQGLTPEDLADYLPRTARLMPATRQTKWESVLTHLRTASPRGEALASALQTPMMASLARTVYSDTDRDPAELLDAEKFPDTQAISDHLLDSFTEAKYDDIPLADENVRKGRVRARSAEQWLGFLAVMLYAEQRRGFAWWKFHMRPSRFNTLAYVFPIVLGLTGFGLCVIGLLQGREPDKRMVFAGSMLTFTGLACMWLTLAILGGMKTSPRKLGRPSRWWRGKNPGISLHEFYRGTIAGHELIALLICGLAAVSWTMVTSPKELVADGRLLASYGIVFAVAMVTGPFILTTVHPGLTEFSSPAQLFRSDRRASILRGVYYGIFASLLCMATWLPFGEVRWLFLTPMMVLIGIGGGILSSCSGVWSLRQTGFTVTGRLPMRLLAFMEDAHSRGVLHQVGGVYQFRHGSLQNRLALNYVRKLRKSIAQTPTMLRTRWIMFGSLYTSGRSDVAEAMLEDLLEDLRQKYGTSHIVTLIVWRVFATIRLDSGNLEQAQQILEAVNEEYKMSLNISRSKRFRGIARLQGSPPFGRREMERFEKGFVAASAKLSDDISQTATKDGL